jgi:hypothetical protein
MTPPASARRSVLRHLRPDGRSALALAAAIAAATVLPLLVAGARHQVPGG